MDWREHITYDDVCSFAWGAVRLYETLVELEFKGFGTLVVPSRGTFPFTDRLFTIHQKWSKTREHENRVLHGSSTPFHRSQITLPFTADSTLDDPAAGQGISYQIRDYWVKVLRAWIDGDLHSPELNYYQFVQEHLLGISVGRNASIIKPSRRFVFVDTVVSGRAVVEIESSMRSCGLNECHYVLIIDQGGQKITQRNRALFNEWQAAGKATLIEVDNLFTEDRGPGITASWCLVAPQLMEAGAKILPGFEHAQVVGAAAGFVRVQHSPALDNLSMTRTNGVFNTLMHSLAYSELVEGSHQVSTHFYEKLIEDLVLFDSEGYGPLDPRETLRVAKNAITANESLAVMGNPLKVAPEYLDVSSSHVVRMYFPEAEVNRILEGYSERIRKGHSAYWYVHQYV